MIQHAFEDGYRLSASHSTTGSQQRRDQFARLPFVEMDRKVAILVIVGMEQRELLGAVCRIVRVVDVDGELLGRLVVRLDEYFQQSEPDAIQIRAADTVFQTRHGWLTGQIVSRQRQTVARGFQTRIATQVVTVIGVLVATGDLEYALPDEVSIRMVDIA